MHACRMQGMRMAGRPAINLMIEEHQWSRHETDMPKKRKANKKHKAKKAVKRHFSPQKFKDLMFPSSPIGEDPANLPEFQDRAARKRELELENEMKFKELKEKNERTRAKIKEHDRKLLAAQ